MNGDSEAVSAGGDIAATVANLEDKLQALAVAISSLVEDTRSRRAPTVWAYDARFPTDVENMYEPEYWDVNIKRWVGPKPELEFHPLLREGSTYRLTVSIVDFITSEAELSFGVRVNGLPAKLEVVGRGTYRTTFSTHCDGEQRITLFSDVAKAPADISSSEDRRLLSFSISNIFIVEAA